jgi:hypothetical protein
MKVIGILISPTGEEWFDAYGPMSKDKSKASLFASAAVAHGAAMNRFGRLKRGFWDCETEHEAKAEKEYRGWTNRVEEMQST